MVFLPKVQPNDRSLWMIIIDPDLWLCLWNDLAICSTDELFFILRWYKIHEGFGESCKTLQLIEWKHTYKNITVCSWWISKQGLWTSIDLLTEFIVFSFQLFWHSSFWRNVASHNIKKIHKFSSLVSLFRFYIDVTHHLI